MKYRAWDTFLNRWRDEFDWIINPATGNPMWVNFSQISKNSAKQLILCRFTGAKDNDADGIDIYENDIIKVNDVHFVVKWDVDSNGWGIDFLNDSDRGGCDFDPWMLHQVLSDSSVTVSVVGTVFQALKHA